MSKADIKIYCSFQLLAKIAIPEKGNVRFIANLSEPVRADGENALEGLQSVGLEFNLAWFHRSNLVLHFVIHKNRRKKDISYNEIHVYLY